MIRIRQATRDPRPFLEALQATEGRGGGARSDRTLILFGSTLGETERVAGWLSGVMPGPTVIAPVSDYPLRGAEGFERIILGTSTWEGGELQAEWVDVLPELRGLDLRGRRVALFGLGDARSYPRSFVDGLGRLHEALKGTGATRTGYWSTEGYTFDASRALEQGRFVGLPLDEVNQGELTRERLRQWVREL
nr:flavodoxin [uncultured Holophaga sp.]